MSVWNRYATTYDRLWVQRVSLGPTRKLVIQKLSQIFKQGEPFSLLDMSCGTGQLLTDIATHFPSSQRLGIEPSALGTTAMQKGHQVMTLTIDALIKPNFTPGFDSQAPFDAITCTHAFPYYPNQPGAILALSRHLKPGGHLLIAHAEAATLYDSLALSLVKLTTSKAHYPTPKSLKHMLAQPLANLTLLERIRINGPGVPSITLYLARKNP